MQCWVSDPQLTSTRFTLLIDRRGRNRFPGVVTLVLFSVSQICLQRSKVLQVTLAGMSPKYREIYILVVRAIGQFLAVIDVAMLKK